MSLKEEVLDEFPGDIGAETTASRERLRSKGIVVPKSKL